MLNIQSVRTYVFVFFGVIALMGLNTVRCMFMAGGKKVISSFIAFAEVMLWLTVTSTVVTNVTEDPIKLAAYCLGGAVGTKIGQIVNIRLNSRIVFLEAEASSEGARAAAAALMANHFPVTMIDCRNAQGSGRSLLCVDLLRKSRDEAIALIRNAAPDAIIAQSVPYSLHGSTGSSDHDKER